MQRHRPIDLNAAAVQSAQTATGAKMRTTATASSQQAAASTTGDKSVIPVVEEQLRVGKRAVQSGGVRIHSRVTEKPVQEQVNLREEHVKVERRPVDRPLSDADKAAFRDRTIEVTETREEPVVSKQARVVEEVAVNKSAAQRTETVRDTVRRTDVDVQGINSQSDSLSPDRFAQELAADDRFRGRDWTGIEPEARRTFEQRYPGNKWEQFKDAVHRGYDRVRQKV